RGLPLNSLTSGGVIQRSRRRRPTPAVAAWTSGVWPGRYDRPMSASPARVRALTARSAILSVLLGSHPAQAPAGWIVRVGAGLGLQESAVRAALTRMVAAGDLERGADATYRLSERLADRQRRQDQAISP